MGAVLQFAIFIVGHLDQDIWDSAKIGHPHAGPWFRVDLIFNLAVASNKNKNLICT